ncbi:putative odorant receptor 85d isoform X2 [Diachasma alloeum]|uniref:Odorant receptor n=1 Tax=Diachasma alloeum TaxID=454923 RepID=A0A4E0S1C3_9HYME|nr:putative odorant receptor 85d isoform X2 [Diachasma alloeum]THK33240.1 odorant receptor 148 [Diachasma alloeum]
MSSVSDFWEHPYYKLGKRVSYFVAQWPYESTRILLVHRTVIFSFLSLQYASQISAAWINRYNLEILMESLAFFIIDIGVVVKYVNNCYHCKTIIHLLEQIKYNWQILPKNNGLHQLHNHSAFAEKFALVYMLQMWLSVVPYAIEPLEQRLVYHFLYPNITLPKRFSMPLDFGPIDVDTWYYYLWFGTACTMGLSMTMLGACDLLLFIFAEHACGLLSGLGYAIEHLPHYDESESIDYSFQYMRSCAVIHSRAINFAEHIRQIYLWSFFGIIGLNMFILSATGVQKLLKFAVSLAGQLLHLFVECFLAQRVMDASFNLMKTLTNSKWYDASLKTRKTIPLMLMRAQSPVILTAGTLIPMNMNTFAVVVKTAVSYFTVLLAMQ